MDGESRQEFEVIPVRFANAGVLRYIYAVVKGASIITGRL
jgi:hypothetical protein